MKLRKNVGKLITKYVGVKGIAAGAVSLLLVTGGFHILWEDYQNGNLFKPELFVKNRELQGNQIMFPEKENIQENNTDPEENDNKKLERDPGADDPYGQEKQNDTSYEMTQDQIQTNPENAGNLFTDPSMGFVGNTDGSSWPADGRNAVLSPDAEEKVNIPAGMTGLTEGNENGTGAPVGQGNTPVSPGGDTTISGGSGSTGSGSGSGQEPGTTPGGNNTSTPGTIPDQPNTPDNPSDDGGNTAIVDPDYPDDSKGPQLPNDPADWGGGFIVYPDFPEEGLPEESEEAKNAQLVILLNPESVGEFYEGAVITDWKLLCSVYAFVDTPTGRYRLRNYSNNFKVGAHPDIAEGNFKVTFSFRPYEHTDTWIDVEQEFSVKYSKTVVMGFADAKGKRRVLSSNYLEKGQSINLLNQLEMLYTAEGIQTDQRIEKIIPGWYVAGKREVYSDRYEPEAPGRYEIYPMEKVELPAELGVVLAWDFDDDGQYIYEQMLNQCDNNTEELVVPQGIQRISLGSFTVGKVIIPESVSKLADNFIQVTDSYKVSEKNSHFCSENGLLYNKSKTELLGIPARTKKIEVPESVEKVVLPQLYGNEEIQLQLEEITFLSATPPDIDLSKINGVKLIVPTDSYPEYLLNWRKKLGANALVPADQNVQYNYVDGAILTENNKVLVRISDENSGLWNVPDGVELIKSYAADQCTDIDRMLIPESVKVLESKSLNGNGLREIYFQGKNPPDITENTFGDLSTKKLTIYVSSEERKAAYVEKWKEVLGEETAERLIQVKASELVDENGLVYLNTSGSVLLLQAPDKIDSFDEILSRLPKGAEVTEIGSDAFSGCTLPKTLELPASVVKIEKNAFARCEGLEGIISLTTEPIYIGKDAFKGIRYMAYDTDCLKLEDSTMTRQITTYVTPTCKDQVNYAQLKAYGSSYVMENGLVFGLNGKGEELREAFLIGAESDFDAEVKAPEDYHLTLIAENAMSACGKSFTIPEDTAADIVIIESSAFAHSGIQGTVAFSGNLIKIGEKAFSGCSGLNEVTFTEDHPFLTDDMVGLKIADQAFTGTALTEVEFPGQLLELGYDLFEDTEMGSITFTGEEVPKLTYPGMGTEYIFGVEEKEGLLHLGGSAEEKEDEYIFAWKNQLEGYEDESEITENSVYWTASSRATTDWLNATNQFPWDDNYDYYPEFLNYLNEFIPYLVENIKVSGEYRAYILFGLEAPKDPDTLEKPNIQDYIDELNQRLEDEKEEALQKKEDLLDPVKVPQEEKKLEQEEVVEDPSKKDEEETPEDPEEDTTDPGTEEDPEDPDPSDPDDSGEDGSDEDGDPDNSGEDGGDDSDNSGEDGGDNSGDTDDSGNNGSDAGNENGGDSGNEDGDDKDDSGSDTDNKDDEAGENGGNGSDSGENGSETPDASSDNETDTTN